MKQLHHVLDFILKLCFQYLCVLFSGLDSSSHGPPTGGDVLDNRPVNAAGDSNNPMGNPDPTPRMEVNANAEINANENLTVDSNAYTPARTGIVHPQFPQEYWLDSIIIG